jgi:hypothetical protein
MFINQIRLIAIAFAGKITPLEGMFKEIAKNIYDHNKGNGYLILNKIGDSIEFEIGNRAAVLPDTELFPKTGRRVNFGVGLRNIPEIAKTLGIELKINIPGGYVYSGTFLIKKP